MLSKEWETFFNDTIKKFEDNDIIYIADSGTLLGAIRHKGKIPWDNDYDISIPIESYYKIKKLFPESFACSDDKGYPFIYPKFVPDKSKILESNICIDMFVIVPTTNKKIKKFRKIRNWMIFSYGLVNSNVQFSKHYPKKLITFCLRLFFFIRIKEMITFEKAVNILYEKNKPETFYMLIDPIKKRKIHLMPLNTWERHKVNFDNIKIYIPNNYDEILKNKYGNYKIPVRYFDNSIRPNALSILKDKK